MRHPAWTKRFFFIAVITTFMGLIFAGGAVSDPGQDYSQVGLLVGCFLLALGLINFGVHALAVLMHDHEMWRASHFTEILEKQD